MKKLFTLLFAVAAIVIPSLARADGFIIVPQPPDHPPIIMPPRPRPWPPAPPPHPVYAPLEVSFHHVECKIEDQVATTEIDQEFVNPTSARLEGFYVFPLPKGARMDKFSMFIDGKEMMAELLPAEKARGIYEDIVRQMRDPALLEYIGRDMFRARIFPIEPHSKKRIKISYTQLLKAENDLVEYLYPLNTEKWSAKPLRNVSVKVSIANKEPILNVYSPTHNVDIRRADDRHVTVGFEAQNTKPDMDFQLFFSRKKNDLGLSLLTYRPNRGEDGYFLLLGSPRWTFNEKQASQKDVVFVADTSGSMAGPKIEQLKRALQYCIASLNPSDRFEIVRFSTEAEPLFGALKEANKDAVTEARKFVETFRAAGGTAIDEALQKAMKIKSANSKRPFIVVFLTDGRPTIGETSEDKIVSGVRGTDSVTRIFSFGIGTDLNTHLLDRITEETKAASQYVLPEEDIEVKVSGFFDKIREPVLTNVALKVEGGPRARQLYPSALPDLFKGEQLVVFGRYSGSGDAAITVTGNVNGKEQKFVFEDKFAERSDERSFIARLWATRRVGYLLDEIRLRGESAELKDEIIQLAREHGIVTPYTAYLIVEDEKRRVASREIEPRAQTLGANEVMRDERVKKEAEAQYEVYAKSSSKDEMKSGWRANMASEAAKNLKFAGNMEQQSAQQRQGDQGQKHDQGQMMGGGFAGPPAASAPADLSRYYGANGGRMNADGKADAPVAMDLSQQVRNIGARTFYQNGASWVDSEVQKQKAPKRVQIKFNSKEYFELLTKVPEAARWLSLGTNVQFVHGDTVYEIIEAEGSH